MAEAIVPSLLKLIPALLKLSNEEWDLGSQAKTELAHLKDLIGAIERFLKKANSKEVIDEDLKASMKRMREILYDSADAIDDFMESGNCMWDGLGASIYNHISRRTLASEAKSISKIVENHETSLETIHKLSAGLAANSSSACHQSLSIAFSDEKDDDLVGIRKAREELVRWLTTGNSPTRKVIFVHGTQGVGKTSLVGAVLREEAVRRQFQYYVWVKDLRSCELVDDKAEALMKVNAEIWYPTEDGLVLQLELKEVFRRLGNKNIKWVLILDDAGSTHVFESLRSHLAQTRPSVLVTTRDSSLRDKSKTLLGSQMAQSGDSPSEPAKLLYDICHFKHVSLSEDDSVKLFWQTMSHMDADRAVLKDACDSILRRCEGLPLAILAVSYLLSDIHQGVNGTSQIDEWKNLSGKLGEALLFNGDKSGLIKRMVTLRMDHFYDVLGCLFYLSIFPLDRPISCSTLMQLWMAERFIEQKGTSPAQEIAEATLKKLVDHNLFREVAETSYGRAKTCHIHNILHQIIISKSKNDEFAMIVVDPQEAWPETVWRLSFHCKMLKLEDGSKVKRLRSLLVFESLYPDCMEELLKQVSRLNVLDIEYSSLNQFPKEIFDLKYLRYLSLKGASVSKIPDDIKRLKHLETLNLKGTNVTELPESILQLQLLRHLLVYRSNGSPASSNHTKIGVRAPARLGDLTLLLKLCMIDLKVKRSFKQSIQQWIGLKSSHGQRLLRELGKLENLRRLGISNLECEHVEHLHSLITKLTRLKSLHLIAAAQSQMDLNFEVGENQVSTRLQRVHLTGHMVSLPTWILSQSLVKLVLKGSKLNVNDPLQHFKKLPSLKHLELQQAFYGVSEMVFEEGGFQKLRFLGLDTFDSLESITIAEKALPALEKLSLARCEKLRKVPQGITYPKQLKLLELHEMPEAFMTAVGQDNAVHAHMTILTNEWRDGAVVGGHPTDHPIVRPRSSRPSIANRK